MEQEDIQKKESKGAHVLVSLSVYVVAFLFLSVVFSMLGYIVIGLPGTSSLTLSQYAIIQSATLLAAVLPAYFILKYFDHRPLSDLGLSIKGRGRDILYGLLAAVVLYGVGFGLSLLSGEVKVTGVQLSVVVTVDHQTLEDNCVTLRNRDTMKQERVAISELNNIIADRVSITSLLKTLQ